MWKKVAPVSRVWNRAQGAGRKDRGWTAGPLRWRLDQCRQKEGPARYLPAQGPARPARRCSSARNSPSRPPCRTCRHRRHRLDFRRPWTAPACGRRYRRAESAPSSDPACPCRNRSVTQSRARIQPHAASRSTAGKMGSRYRSSLFAPRVSTTPNQSTKPNSAKAVPQ